MSYDERAFRWLRNIFALYGVMTAFHTMPVETCVFALVVAAIVLITHPFSE